MRSPLRTLFNKAPVPYVSRSAGWRMPFMHRNDSEAQMRAMGSVGTLFSIVHRTSNATSQVDWHLWRKPKSGLEEDRVEVTRHAALDIWAKPNPFMPRQEFVEAVQQHVDLTGEGWWVIARNPAMRSIPLELWPVRPDRIYPVPHPTDFISGYIYLGPDGEQVPLERDEVIQLRMPNPLDPYRGMGPVQSILTDLDSTRYSAEWNRNFFLNSAEPGGIIEIDGQLGDEEFTKLRDRWAEQHRGVAAAHRVAMLEQGMKWVERKFTNRDMQFVEMRGVSRDVIREAFGIAGFALGDIDDVNRATADASKAWFAEMLTVPRLERFKGALNHDFLPLFGATATGLEFDYVSPVPADREADNAELTSRAEAASKLAGAGWEPAGVLAAVGLPEIVYVGARTSVTSPPPLPAPAGASPTARLRARTALPRLTAQDDPETTREDWQDRLDDLLQAWQEVTEDQRAELLEQIEQAVRDGAPADLAALTASSSAGAALLEAALIEQAQAAGERMVDAAEEQGVSITAAVVAGVLAADLAAAAMVTAALLAAGLAAAAGREALRVWAPGATPGQVSGRVGDHLEGLSGQALRAELGGAIWSAENQGRFATLAQAEQDGNGATWYEASEIRDANTCAPCSEIDGNRFDTLSEAQAHYPNGGYFSCLGTIRCRGTIEPHWGGS